MFYLYVFDFKVNKSFLFLNEEQNAYKSPDASLK